MESEFDASYFATLDHPWIVATTQGWMRTANAEGLVHHIPWKNADQILPNLRTVVFSQEDVKYDMDVARRYAAAGPVVLYTKGLDGSILFYEGKEIRIGSAPANVVDLTGAGDVIAATFFVYFRETGDPIEAAIHGAVASAMAIEHPGATGLPSRAELEARLATIPRDILLPRH
jgi:sugar/nucleoside kinase (ribokinase family)